MIHELLFQRDQYGRLVHTTSIGTRLNITRSRETDRYYFSILDADFVPYMSLLPVPYKDRSYLGKIVKPSIEIDWDTEEEALEAALSLLSKTYNREFIYKIEHL